MGCCGKTIVREVKSPVEETVEETVEEGGSILFNRVAPTRVGYVHDRSNPNRLIPDTIPCTKRITLPVLGSVVWVLNQCNHPECPKRGETVDEIICGVCPFRTETPTRKAL
jgi:hypothetical protein